MNQKQAVKIELGSFCIEIQCQDQGLMEQMLINYRPFLVSREPDFRIKLKLRNKLTAPEVKQMISKAKAHTEGNRYFTEPELLEYRIDWGEATLRVDTERELFAPGVDFKLINGLMCGIYPGIYARLRHTRPEAYLVHGCGIVAGEKCYLFTGPSGSGKTTVASLADTRKVLNDEAVLVARNGDGFSLSGTPFDGGILNKCNASAHLSAIFFLKHDTQVSLKKLSKVETYIRFLSQIFATSPLLETSADDCLPERADLSAGISTGVPAYELAFRPDNSFWPAVEAI